VAPPSLISDISASEKNLVSTIGPFSFSLACGLPEYLPA